MLTTLGINAGSRRSGGWPASYGALTGNAQLPNLFGACFKGPGSGVVRREKLLNSVGQSLEEVPLIMIEVNREIDPRKWQSYHRVEIDFSQKLMRFTHAELEAEFNRLLKNGTMNASGKRDGSATLQAFLDVLSAKEGEAKHHFASPLNHINSIGSMFYISETEPARLPNEPPYGWLLVQEYAYKAFIREVCIRWSR
jgi:hypothetical protein